MDKFLFRKLFIFSCFLPQVFFHHDGINFPDLIHALKPDPITNVQEPWRIADYFSHFPESMHMFSWVRILSPFAFL